MGDLIGRCWCGALIKEWRGQPVPHACTEPRARIEPCGTPRCTHYLGHLGRCNIAPLTRPLQPIHAGTAAAIDPREFTAFAGPDRPVFGPILRGIASSPIGAMWGLALLFLLWLSGCA